MDYGTQVTSCIQTLVFIKIKDRYKKRPIFFNPVLLKIIPTMGYSRIIQTIRSTFSK